MRTRRLALLVVLLTASLALAWYALAPTDPAFQGNLTAACAQAPDDLTPDQAPDASAQEQASSRTHADDQRTGPVKPPPVKEPSPADPEPQPGQIVEERRAVQPPSNAQEKPDTPPQETPAETPTEAPTKRPFIRGHDRPVGQNLGNTRPSARRVSRTTGVKAPAEVSDQLKQDRRGLYAQYYRLEENKLPEALPETPAYTRIDRQVSFPDAESFAGVPVGENFAAVWTGFLVIERADDYWLFWGADNGGRVELAGQTVLLQDGMVRYVEVSTVLTLQPGVYPLTIEFAQFNNGVQDWRKAAANFLWVPQGESKPVPVPPEMLLLPEWMWSDHAPIITGLSKSEGEIGDEITIEGKNFKDPWTKEQSRFTYSREVTFAGQRARVLSESDTQISVRVPIGAQTGDIIVRAKTWEVRDKDVVEIGQTPSNSMPFKVTTQFGLLGEWTDLFQQDPPDFDDVAELVPTVTRHEPNVEYSLDALPQIEVGPFFVRLAGQLGLPAGGRPSGALSDEAFRELRVFASGRCRVTCGHRVQNFPEDVGGLVSEHHDCIRFSFDWSQSEAVESFIIEWISSGNEPTLRLEWAVVDFYSGIPGSSSSGHYTLSRSPARHTLFPPQQPKAPPVVWSVVNAAPDPWKPPLALPASSRPSAAVGETMNVTLQVSTSQLLSPVMFALDGVAMPAEFVESKDVLGGWHVTYAMAVPPGVGEGKLTAAQGGSTSEPFLIDIANRGLIGFYYDFPQPGGLSAVPELAALECFALRKEKHVRFESVADFDLPFPAETFAIEWYSALIVEVEGDYTFTGRTDDGMRLWIDGNLVIDANKPQAPAENSSVPIHLKPGVYPLRMQYFENNQHEVCVLEWRATTGAEKAEVLPRQVIPARAFSLDALPVLPAKQANGRRTDGS